MYFFLKMILHRQIIQRPSLAQLLGYFDIETEDKYFRVSSCRLPLYAKYVLRDLVFERVLNGSFSVTRTVQNTYFWIPSSRPLMILIFKEIWAVLKKKYGPHIANYIFEMI